MCIRDRKSTVTDILKNKYGFLILKTEDIAKELERPGESVYKKLTEVFGTAILEDDDSKAQSEENNRNSFQDEINTGTQNRDKEKAEGSLDLRPIDKAKFAQLIYSDNEALRKVNAIVHPAVWSYVREQIRAHEDVYKRQDHDIRYHFKKCRISTSSCLKRLCKCKRLFLIPCNVYYHSITCKG